jgi:hypothetical protein
VAVTWHAVDLKTGRRGQQITTASLGTVGRIIGEPTDLSGLAVACQIGDEPVVGWEQATLPGRMMLVACDDDDVPVWGGMVLRRRSTSSSWVSLDLATCEAYFDRRYVTDHTYAATSQGAIVSGIITDNAIATGIEFTVDASSSFVRDRTYLDDEDKTVLSVLQDLMAVEGGPEFTVDLEWNADHTTLARIVRVRDRIGTASTLPVTRFEMPGNVVDFEYVEDYSGDNGANDVMATSSGEGDARPTSAHQVAQSLIDNGWVKYERRFTPSTSIIDTNVLDAHARAELAQTQDGLAELTLEVDLSDGRPLPWVDFHLGDDVAVALTCPRFPEVLDANGALGPGYTKNVRCVGWEVDLDANRLKPRLLEVG